MKCSVVALLALLFCSGCTTLSLKRQTLSQVESVADLRYREVMENLAMVYDNPAALPTHCSVYNGTADVTDTIPVTAGLAWARTIPKVGAAFTAFSAGTLDFATTRAIKKNWTLDPTIVPEKLYAMRAACWWAVFGENNQFGDALTLEKHNDGFPPGMYFDVANQLRALPEGWLHFGRKGTAPRCALYQAGCRDRCVWVEPEGMLGLSQFTLVIQGIARVSCGSVTFPQGTTNTVVLQGGQAGGSPLTSGRISKITVYLDKDGRATPGPGLTALPTRGRMDNVGLDTALKSSITAATK